MDNALEAFDNPILLAEICEFTALKLRPIVGDNLSREPKPTDYVLDDKV